MRRLLALCCVLTIASPGGAQAQEDTTTQAPEGTSLFAAADACFGTWAVGPFARVLFFDVAFWDNGAGALERRALAAGMSEGDARALAAMEAPEAHELGWCESAGDALPALRAAQCTEHGMSSAQCKDVIGGLKIPFIVLWLIAGALFFTFRFGFINVRAFKHAVMVTSGKYDKHDDPGEVSHFQALSSALSATVGLGNIAGVAVAVSMGGPGAVLWMVIAGFFGMNSKFVECTLGQLFREVDDRGRVSGGPMRYLRRGLADRGPKWGAAGRVLAVLFALLCIGGSFGGGNMFQANQSAAQVASLIPWFQSDIGHLVYGVILALLVGVVIIGGIKRIGAVAGYVVPFMCGIYVLAGLFILLANVDKIGWAFGEIVGQAFTPAAGLGGAAGVLVMGFQRAAFSNEAGTGSASIAHSAAATDEPVREGIVALLEPFIDTIIVCTMTGLVVVITGAYDHVNEAGDKLEGIAMTSWAFGQEISWFPKVLSFAAFLFAFSTMISWSYYGERCWNYLYPAGGELFSMVYRVLFLLFVILGSVLKLGSVLDFSDLMILGMAFPNIVGLLLLSPRVSKALNDYWSRYKSGQMPVPAKAPHADG